MLLEFGSFSASVVHNFALSCYMSDFLMTALKVPMRNDLHNTLLTCNLQHYYRQRRRYGNLLSYSSPVATETFATFP